MTGKNCRRKDAFVQNDMTGKSHRRFLLSFIYYFLKFFLSVFPVKTTRSTVPKGSSGSQPVYSSFQCLSATRPRERRWGLGPQGGGGGNQISSKRDDQRIFFGFRDFWG